MRTRTQRWWLAGGLVLALISGGTAVHTSVRLAEDIQKPGHGLQAGYGLSGSKTRDGFGLGGKTIAGFGIGGQPVAVRGSSNHLLAGYGLSGSKTRDGYALGG